MTPKQQRAATLRQLERDRKRAVRERIAELRAKLRALKRRRIERRKEVRQVCRRARQALRERAARIRAELKAERARALELCRNVKARAEQRSADEIAAAEHDLAETLSTRDIERIWTGKPQKSRTTAKERREESDDEVERDIPDELAVVWHRVKHRIKGSARRSRTEAFLEWAAEHQETVYEITNEQLERDVRALERQYRQQARSKSALIDEVPF